MNDKSHIGQFRRNLTLVLSILLLVNILLPFNSSSDITITELSDSISVWVDDLADLTGINASSNLIIEDGDASLINIRFDPRGWEVEGVAIPNGTVQDMDSRWTMQPYVLKEGNEYRMWYTGYNSTGVYHIMYATSIDNINWVKHGAVFGPEYGLVNDLWLIAVPSILKDDSSYKMYYSGSDVDERNYFNMYMATSPDGITWTDHGMVLGKGDNDTTESLGLMNGKVIKTPDNTYKMYYTAYDGMVWRLHLAISDDGINWVRKGLILDNGPAGSDDYEKLTEPFVIYHRDTYFMWYTGYPMAGKTVICFATSLDGENWTKQGMVVDSSIVTDSIRVGGANVIIDDDGLIKLWYYGFDGYLHLIHYATMQSHSFHYLNEGELTSEIIDIPNNKVWTSLNISKTDIDADNAITVSIQDADTGEIIDGFLNLTTEIIDLTGINYLDHPNIQLTARFTSDGTDTPILHSWELTMSDDTTDYITIQTKTGEAVHFNCSHTFDNDDIANCTWTFEYNRSTTTLYGEDCRFHFWTPGNYSVILKITDSLGIEKRSKVLVDVSENGVHSDIMDYIWLSVLITAMVLVGMAFMLRNRGSSPSGGVAQEEQEAILDGSPVNIIENIEQRYAEGAISETTYLKLKDKYSEEDE